MKRLFLCVFVLLFTSPAFVANANTTLAAGDIAFIGYNSFDGTSTYNEFSFVILKDGGIDATTVINFTDCGWDPVLSELYPNEGHLAWTSGAALPQFTVVVVDIASGGTSLESISHGSGVFSGGNFILSGAGDQILAYQGTIASPTFIAAIHMNSEIANNASAATSAGTWDDVVSSNGWTMSANRSAIPPGLDNGVHALIGNTAPGTASSERRMGLFDCNFASAATLNDLRNNINNVSNWTLQNAPVFSLTPACSFQLITGTSPEITTDPADSTICAGSNASFTVAGNDILTYRWQVDQGAGFTDLTNTSPYSGADAATLVITGATSALNGAAYRVIVTGALTPDDTSATATLTVVSLTANSSQTNVSCNGGENGSATINVTGGTGPYTYNWSSGGNAGTESDLAAGGYTVTVTDANGCETSASFTITEPDAIVTTPSQSNVDCFGGNNGIATVSVSGGTGSYIYVWSPSGGTDPSAVGLTAGTYTVLVTDANDCTASQSITVTEPTQLTSANTQVDISCFGQTDGSATVTVSGGTAPYLYNWSTNDVDSTVTGLGAGTVTVDITDDNGCSITETFTIIEPSELQLAGGSLENVACNGDSTGSASVVVAGGTAPYTYLWAPIGTTDDSATGLPAGSYSILITDDRGCTISANFDVTQPDVLVVTDNPATNVSCNGGNDGSASVTVTGGTAPYTYAWSPSGGTDSVATGLAAGAYSVLVTDDNGCTGIKTFTITEPGAYSVSPSQVNVSCFGGNDGSASVVVSGATAPYTYSWSPNTADTTAALSNLTAGTYTVVITDANNCTASATFTLSENDALLLATAATDVLCNGDANGAVSVTADGGVEPYLYLWSNGGIDSSVTNLAAGNYTVTVSDDNGCSATALAMVKQPDALTSLNSHTNVTCNGAANGTATVNVSGGTGAYTYAWTSGGSNATETGLAAGTYDVTITDENNCSILESFTITEPNALQVSTARQRNVSCFSLADGLFEARVTGGTAPYTYTWSPMVGTDSIAEGLTAGVYTVVATDANGCSASRMFFITEPTQIITTTSQTDLVCFGDANGTATVNVSGGRPLYTYTWSNGGNNSTATGLSAGPAAVTVTDNDGCSVVASVTIAQPDQIAANAIVADISCNNASDGSIALAASGGTAGYTYFWPHNNSADSVQTGLAAGDYAFVITDAANCTFEDTVTITNPDTIALSAVVSDVNCLGAGDGEINLTVTGGTAPYNFVWSNTATSEDLTGLTPGTYDVTVVDDNGCSTALAGIEVTEPATAVSVVVDSTTGSPCFAAPNGAVYITVSGGTPGYTFAWSNGQTTEDNLAAAGGANTVTVTDANGCSVSVSATVDQPVPFEATGTPTAASCNNNDGAIDLSVTGGIAPYTFAWSNDSTTEDINGLAAGTYTVTVNDNGGCSTTALVTVGGATPITATATITNVSCNRGSDGEIDITVIGGTGPYTFAWSTGDNTEDIDNLAAGTYTVTITDANNCTGVASFNVTEPTEISAVATGSTLLCNGDTNGSVDLAVTGGTPNYTFLWSNNGETTEDISGLLAGTYTVTVTDANSCSITASATVAQPAALSATATATDISCNGNMDGEVNLSVTGGTAPYTYTWDNSETTEDLDNLAAGNYTVTVSDDNGCQTTASATVNEPAVLTVTATPVNASCAGNDGEVGVDVTGGSGAYTFNWSNGGNTEDIANLVPGTYIVTVTDANGCSATATADVIQPSAFPVTVSATDASCNGATDGAVYAVFTETSAVVSYGWSPGGAGEDTLTGVAAGTYVFTLVDTAGCTTTLSVQVAQPTAITATSDITATSCYGSADGGIDLTVSGGAGGYTYSWTGGGANEDATGLAAGDYSVTVTDLSNCSVVLGPYTVTQPDSLSPSLDSLVNVACFGDSTGDIYITITGGTAPYTYVWSNGSTGEDLINVPVGQYTATVTDANGCQFNNDLFPAEITQPAAALDVTAMVTDASCGGNDGGVNLTVTGGTAPYTYAWSNDSIAEDLVNVGAGTYTATITDANGCVTTTSATVNLASGLTASATATDVPCAGDATGTVTLTVNGGTTPYVFAWSNTSTDQNLTNVTNGTYTVTVSDAGGCSITASATVGVVSTLSVSLAVTNNLCFEGFAGAIDATVTGGSGNYTYQWSNTMIDEDITNLPSGFYEVTVSDGGCNITATALITEPAEITVGRVVTNISCYGLTNGSINLTVSGGAGGYTYAWDNDSTSEDLTDLAAGGYTVTVTDANSCNVIYGPFQITEPDSLSAALDSTVDVKCFGDSTGAVYVTISGGTAPYTYLWSNGSTDPDLVGVPAGLYGGTVTDANGCSISTGPAPIIPVNQPAAAVSATLDTVTHVTCNGADNGAISITATGGTGALEFDWSNTETTEDITGLAGGSYTVTVTDANGCSFSASYTVNEPAALTLTTVPTNVSCQGGNNGAIDLTVTGGTAAYTYSWGTEDQNNLVAGTYNVTVTDANGCSATASASITFTSANPTVSLGNDRTQCGGSVTLDAGNAGATFLWSNSDNTQTTTVTASGQYSVIVTTAGGCVGYDTVNVTINANPTVTFNVPANICSNASPLTLSATPSGGTFSGTGVTGTTFNPATAGVGTHTLTYTVTVNNCTGSATDNIIVDNCIGIEEVAVAKVLLFPNPNNGTFMIKMENATGVIRGELFNELGQIIQVIQLDSNNSYTHTVSDVEAGIYFLATHNGEITTTQRVLVVK